MPPGSKKRRAAKRKMENQSNPSSPAAHSHGNEFAKHHDEKHNDFAEEVNSPRSQPPHNPFAEGLVVNDSVVHVERDFKIEGKSVIKNDRGFEHVESMRKSYNETSFSSSGNSNSSDDEFRGTKDSPSTEDKKITLPERSVEAILSLSVPIEAVEQTKCESLLIGEEKNPSYEESRVGVSLEKNENVIVQPVEETAFISEQIAYATEQTDDRLTLPFNNGVEQENECAPLLVPSSFPEKKASRRSCCGLFDMFWGSGR